MRFISYALFLSLVVTFANCEQSDGDEMEDSDSDLMRNLQNNYLTGMLTIVNFFQSINTTISELNEKIRHLEAQNHILQQNVNHSQEKFGGLDTIIEATVRRVLNQLRNEQQETTEQSTRTTAPTPTTTTTVTSTNIVSECPEMSGQVMAGLLKNGSRVVRGADWSWDDQDGNPPGEGRVISLGTRDDGWVSVEWVHGETNNYRMGADGKYDLRLVDCANATTIQMRDPKNLECLKPNEPIPSGSEMASRLKNGTVVVRGNDWKWGSQDGNPPGKGTLISTVVPGNVGWVRVEWENNSKNNYRMGAEGAYDLKFPSCTD